MSKILSVYKDFLEKNDRFIDEIFDAEIYSEAVPKLTVIDLGAFGGEFGFYVYNMARDIYAFEPDPRPYAELERRVREFKMDKMKVYPIAMSDHNGKSNFFASGYGGSFMTSEAGENNVEVETITLATFMNHNKIEHVDILKVDIEGGETPVFNSDDFKDVAGKIDLIIGEHLGSVDGTLKSYGFKATAVNGSNTVYKR